MYSDLHTHTWLQIVSFWLTWTCWHDLCSHFEGGGSSACCCLFFFFSFLLLLLRCESLTLDSAGGDFHVIQSPFAFNTAKPIQTVDDVQSWLHSVRDKRSDNHTGRWAKRVCADRVAQCLHYVALRSSHAWLRLKGDLLRRRRKDLFLLKHKVYKYVEHWAVV